MRYITIIVFAFLSIGVVGQNHAIGIKGGLSLTNMDANFGFGLKPDNLKGFHVGITYDYLISDRYHTGADLIYAQRGFSFQSTLTNDVGNTIGYAYTNYNYDYISVPLKIGVRTRGLFHMFAQFGFVPSVLQYADVHFSEINAGEVFLPESKQNMTSKVTSFDFAVNSEVGIGWKINKHFVSYVSASYQRGFTESKNSHFYQGVNGYHYGWMFSTGVKYAFSNKSE